MAEWWTAHLLDRTDFEKGELGMVRGGSLSWSAFRSVPGDGSLEVTLDDELPIDWLSDRIRITHHNDDDGEERERPFGIWLIAAPERQHKGDVTHVTIKLSDKTDLLNSPAGQWVTVPAGAVVTERVAAIIAAQAGETAALTSSPSTLTHALTWKPEDTWLTVVNDLLRAINYATLWADGTGRLRVEPYVAPGDRQTAATYGFEGEQLHMRTEWSDELPLWDVPTGFAVYTEGDETTPGMSARADLPASHPLSAAARGREVVRVESVEATSLSVLQGIAQRRLDDQMSVVRRATITHPVDDTQLNDAIEHAPARFRGAVVDRQVSLAIGAVVSDSVRHIWTDMEALPWL